jgi:integrase
VSQQISAIKFLFTKNTEQAADVVRLPRPKPERKLPDVLSREEIKRILDAVTNHKHKTLLVLTYSAGLRVGEVVRLKVGDIDSNRMLIHVRQGKGRKDRYTILSEVARQRFEIMRGTVAWLIGCFPEIQKEAIYQKEAPRKYLRRLDLRPGFAKTYPYMLCGILLLPIC